MPGHTLRALRANSPKAEEQVGLSRFHVHKIYHRIPSVKTLHLRTHFRTNLWTNLRTLKTDIGARNFNPNLRTNDHLDEHRINTVHKSIHRQRRAVNDEGIWPKLKTDRSINTQDTNITKRVHSSIHRLKSHFSLPTTIGRLRHHANRPTSGTLNRSVRIGVHRRIEAQPFEGRIARR
jgi:hypothetical protein